jgi:hypothetical protein
MTGPSAAATFRPASSPPGCWWCPRPR